MRRLPKTRNSLVFLADEIGRLNGRLRSTFAPARQAVGLGESEFMVLNAVVEAERAPTAAQIGRSLGHPRQLVQRAANSLKSSGLIEMRPNPDHKRAPLLVPTAQGIDLKREADGLADTIAARLTETGSESLEDETIRQATALLRTIRRQFEARLRRGPDVEN